MVKPCVSVVMITYGHGKYIKQAIEGVLMQKCDFNVELIIADDHSPDNTECLVNEIKESHPNSSWIKYTRHLENKGMQPNFSWACKQCQGKYIALCEGDDYWTDPLKLQKQFDFLQQNIDYSLVYCGINILKDCQIESGAKFQKKSGNHDFNFIDSIQGKCGATVGMFFREEILKKFPNSFLDDLPIGDWPLECNCMLYGKGYFIDDVMCVYRVHNGGASNSFTRLSFFESRIIYLEKVYEFVENSNYRSIIRGLLLRIYLQKSNYFFGSGFYKKFAFTLFKAFQNIQIPFNLVNVGWDHKYKISTFFLKLLLLTIIKAKRIVCRILRLRYS